MFDIMKEQSDMLKEMRLKSQENLKKEEAKEEKSLITKSLFGMTEKLTLFSSNDKPPTTTPQGT